MRAEVVGDSIGARLAELQVSGFAAETIRVPFDSEARGCTLSGLFDHRIKCAESCVVNVSSTRCKTNGLLR